jgi:hypothetical protein
MTTQRTFGGVFAALALAGSMLAPLSAGAQSSLDRESSRRQKTKNDWRNLSIGGAAVGLYGLLKGDKTLMFAGAAGALYSLDRYEKDRKSQSKTDRARAQMFGRSSFQKDGHTYVRKTVTKNGKKYYQYVRK